MTELQRNHRAWIKWHRKATLDDLKNYLEGVLEEVLTFE